MATQEDNHMNNDILQTYYKIFTTYWQIFKKYAQIDFTPDYYKNVTDECDKTYQEFKKVDKQFTLDIFKATMGVLVRIKEESKDEGTE